MPVALDAVEFQHREAGVDPNNFQIRLLLRIERGSRHSTDAALHLLVEIALGRNAGGTVIVEQLVERCMVMFVITGRGGSNGRERQAAVDEIRSERVQ